jgi:hypothetical protein
LPPTVQFAPGSNASEVKFVMVVPKPAIEPALPADASYITAMATVVTPKMLPVNTAPGSTISRWVPAP